MTFSPTKQQLEELGFEKSKTPFTAQENLQTKLCFEEYYIFKKGGFYIDCIADSRFTTIIGQSVVERFSLEHNGIGTNLYINSLSELQTLIRLLSPNN